MRRVVNLIVILAVLWCGSHLAAAEIDSARADIGIEAPHDGDVSSDAHPDAAHTGHHHCPVAPDQTVGPALCGPIEARALLFDRPVTRMRSLATAPPTEPPAA